MYDKALDDEPREEARRLVRLLAEPAPAGDSVKAAICRAGRRLPAWSHNRVRDVWHGEPRIKVRAEELDQLRALTKQQIEERAEKDAVGKLRARIERIEQLLCALNAERSSAGATE
jgi:hypothetical protein